VGGKKFSFYRIVLLTLEPRPLLLTQRAVHPSAAGLDWCFDESWVSLIQESHRPNSIGL
jgi:hypothetical protein